MSFSRKLVLWVVLPAFLAVCAISTRAQDPSAMGGDKPFGGSKDVAFAKQLWKAMDGYKHWKLDTGVYKGQSPHGKYVRLYSTWVKVDDRSFPIIVKENYGGRGVSVKAVKKDRKAWLKAITIMLQREEGYDKDNQNWFWVKYKPDGSIEKNPMGMQLAGRVAKGMPKGCISCHSQAGGGDYLFSNDE